MASSLYIHLPFCKTKCPYCDFASFTDKSKSHFQEYLDALTNEIKFRCQNFKSKKKLETIFFGGGTPSVHSASELNLIFETLSDFFIFDEKTEITLEANPGTVSFEKLKEFKEIGINRLSLGVQTFDEDLIHYLARGHSVSEAKEIISLVKEVGFNSWSLDLIYGLPHQSLYQWQASIDQALSFDPPHISSYALSIESNTPFGEIYKNSAHKDLPLEENVVKMYNYLNKTLQESGILRYEISNWAKLGHEAQHNLCYWQAKEYFAFGLSAHGFVNKKRYFNTRDFNNYLQKFSSHIEKKDTEEFIICDSEIEEIVDSQKALEEEVFLGLRLKQGIEISSKIEKKINTNKLKTFIEQGFVENKANRIMLTDEALMISNKIIFELIK